MKFETEMFKRRLLYAGERTLPLRCIPDRAHDSPLLTSLVTSYGDHIVTRSRVLLKPRLRDRPAIWCCGNCALLSRRLCITVTCFPAVLRLRSLKVEWNAACCIEVTFCKLNKRERSCNSNFEYLHSRGSEYAVYK